MAGLFGKNKLRELAQAVPNDQIEEHIRILQTWCDDYHHGSLKRDKETSREQAYNSDVFMKILGYREKPASPHTFEPKATTATRQLPDALISHTDTARAVYNIAAVVELKGASIPLDRPQQREGNMSPVQQGFKYKTQYRSCPFVIVSNFYELRLYNDNQLDYVVWTLDDLVDPTEDYLNFKTFFVLLRAENFTSASGPSETEDLLSDIRQEQEEIGKEFYAEYKAARTALLKDVWANNPNTRLQFELAIHKTQTIIGRVIFACFADDCGLLPDDIVARVVDYAEKSPFEEPLFDHLKGFFKAIDSGSDRLGIPKGYNGGLFAEDPWIDALKISDAALMKLTALEKYDFKDDLSVTILGHIFEQSITDLEEIRRKIAADESLFDAQPLPEPKRGRRKKDGIFYTPDYIVRHIVDATLGEYLRDKETEALKKHKLTGRLGAAGYENAERTAYLEYQSVLQNVRIVDPACGSGAFLVYVFDYLILENNRVDAILGGTLTSQEEFVRNILTDNIFGVDLNEESVEITKLSLWLKTAQKGKRLTTLDSNIKAGNSLVGKTSIDPEAFDWEAGFPEVFAKGGFDVVVGNPPYVQLSQITSVSPELRKYLIGRYGTSGGRLNTFIFFLILGMRLMRTHGRLGFIVPNTLLTQDGYKDARKMILDETDIAEIVQYPDMPFEDATVENITIVLKKASESRAKKRSFDVSEQTDRAFALKRKLDQVPYLTAKNHIFALRGDEVTAHIDGLSKVFEIGDYFNVNQAIALKGDRSLSIHDAKAAENYYKVLDGRHINKYEVEWAGNWLEYVIDRIHSCKRQDIFEQDEKLFFRRTGTSLIAAYDDKQFYALNTLVVITKKDDDAAPLSLKALLAVFNSSTLNHYYGRKYKSTKTVFSEIQARSIQGLPIPKCVKDYDERLASLAGELISLRAAVNAEVAAAAEYVCRAHGVEKVSVITAVKAGDFAAVDALFKQVPISTRREVVEHLTKVWTENEVKETQIEVKSAEIDVLVQDLYGLTPVMRDVVSQPE